MLLFGASTLLVFLFVFTLQLTKKSAVRAAIRRAISGRTFATSWIPEHLDSGLTARALLSVLYTDVVAPEHQSTEPSP